MTTPTLTSVYRYYDRHDVLIYVGITKQGIGRNYQHNQRAEWWPFVARQEVEHYENRPAAALREKHLISTYRPPFNKNHNPEYPECRTLYLAWSATAPALTASTPLELLRALNGAIPLWIMRWNPEDREMLMGIRPEHNLIGSRIVRRPEDRVNISGRPGFVSRLQVRGQLVLITLQSKGRLPAQLTSATARVKAICTVKGPQIFRLAAIDIVPEPGPFATPAPGTGQTSCACGFSAASNCRFLKRFQMCDNMAAKPPAISPHGAAR